MRSARRSKPLSRHLAASCSARERATWTDASVLEALLPRLGLACWRLLCLCSCGSLAEKQRRSWDVRRTWPAAVAVALGFAPPVMSVAVRRPSRMMNVATRPGAPASGAHGHRDGWTKRATSTNDAPASGGRSPSQPPGQRMQARQQGAAAASASAGLGAAVAPLRAVSHCQLVFFQCLPRSLKTLPIPNFAKKGKIQDRNPPDASSPASTKRRKIRLARGNISLAQTSSSQFPNFVRVKRKKPLHDWRWTLRIAGVNLRNLPAPTQEKPGEDGDTRTMGWAGRAPLDEVENHCKVHSKSAQSIREARRVNVKQLIAKRVFKFISDSDF